MASTDDVPHKAVKRASARAAQKATPEPVKDPFYREATEALRRSAEASEKSAEAIADRTHAVDNLAEEVSRSTEALERIEPSIEQLRRDVARRRRLGNLRVAFAAFWFAIVIMFSMVGDVRVCSPGARAQRIIVALLHDPIDLDRVRAAAKEPVPAVCDVVFAVAAHNLDERWPTGGNDIGLAVYGVVFVGGAWLLRRRPWEYEDPSTRKDQP